MWLSRMNELLENDKPVVIAAVTLLALVSGSDEIIGQAMTGLLGMAIGRAMK